MSEKVIATCKICGTPRYVSAKHPIKDNCARCTRRNLGLSRKGFSPPNKTHGLTDTRPHVIWMHMRLRCSERARGHDRKDWYDRGIRVCPEWEASFQVFWTWAKANGYRPDLQIDRENNDGDYTPDNCRWVTCSVNSRNKRNVVLDVAKVRRILDMRTAGVSPSQIAGTLGIRASGVKNVLYGGSWRDEVARYHKLADTLPLALKSGTA